MVLKYEIFRVAMMGSKRAVTVLLICGVLAAWYPYQSSANGSIDPTMVPVRCCEYVELKDGELPGLMRSQADVDYEAFLAALTRQPERPFVSMNPRQRAMFLEEHAMNVRNAAIVFLEAHPRDPRRWNVVVRLNPDAPRFVLEWGTDTEPGEPREIVDQHAANAWRKQVERLKSAMRFADDLPEDVRAVLAAPDERAARKQELIRRWRDGNESAPDFVAYGLNGEKIRVSDFRGKVVILDFWATWCSPCTAAMPHMQSLAKRYSDQGLVVLASATGDRRKDFEKFVREYRGKYPNIIWAHDRVERADDSAARLLYGVTEIPAKFVINPEGRVVDIFLANEEGDDRLEEALTKAGIHVTPGLLNDTQDRTDFRTSVRLKRGSASQR